VLENGKPTINQSMNESINQPILYENLNTRNEEDQILNILKIHQIK